MNQNQNGAGAREASALRTLTTDLQASGWEVVSTAVSGEERTPIAVVCRRGGPDEPIRTFVAACRSLLRAAERVRQVNPALTGEEHETVQAARLTCRVLAERALVSGATLGTFAHAEMAKAVRKQEDGEDAADAEVAVQEADAEAQRRRDVECVRFSGETAWDAVVNHNSLDIVEEEGFLAFCAERGLGKGSAQPELEKALREWVEVTGGRDA